jgi:hypothetical protein
MAVFDGPGFYYGAHPQNILRGRGVRGPRYPLLHEHGRSIPVHEPVQSRLRLQHDVRRAGLDEQSGRWEADNDFSLKSYRDGMACYGLVKREGKAIDLIVSEFADVYRQDHRYTRPSALCRKTYWTGLGDNTSGTLIRGCVSAWT